MRLNAYQSSKLYKERAKAYHDKRILKRSFYPGHLCYCSIQDWGNFLENWSLKWSCPFLVKQVKPYGAVELEDPKSQRRWNVNGQRLKHYLSEIDRLATMIHLSD